MSLIGITMGCPASIGPEIILRYFIDHPNTPDLSAVVLGDIGVLNRCAQDLALPIHCTAWKPGNPLPKASVPVVQLSSIQVERLRCGQPTLETATAMATYIQHAVAMIQAGLIDGMTTCPISKAALQTAGYTYPGHTEMLADLTGTEKYTMMMAGKSLRVTLATIHCALASVPQTLSQQGIATLIKITHDALADDFGITHPRIGVAGLNPHAGEDGLFGLEEKTVITPAISQCRQAGIPVDGPFPPDTIFFKAAEGDYDAVVCMYHDQGLIPFKLLHFSDGVNVTLGLPIVRTSVDHGTAYDIAGKGLANAASLAAAIELAAMISTNRKITNRISADS